MSDDNTDDARAVVADHYRRFAENEADPVSPLFADWARGVASSPPLLERIAALPRIKRQANLVFASARWEGCPLDPFPAAGDWMLQHWEKIVPTILARSTQTNEAARCATLLPELASIDGPIALIEVGMSAGFCLYPDRYAYRYQVGDTVAELSPPVSRGHDGSPVVIDCAVSGPTPLPTRLPDVVWRAGVDLNPIDVDDPEQVRWLQTLVWPGQEGRVERIEAAAAVVRSDPPLVVRGDLVDELPALAASAPDDATLVVIHSAVLLYLTPERRGAFVDVVRSLPAVWLANESDSALAELTAPLPAGVDPRGHFVLRRDGRPLALTGHHGQSLRFL
ncbi:uncharacterized protein DUF2332 [Labedella gwakjiensis]|uniref:DUF2332 domain-containing protein n=1 Tax=Labedella gwakjiensis TaxID=390269 RepID=A0A2P8H150_9MICO|nr:DUF2332 domain-containing protein [Labedella gwakjiensis]PSL39941.1 uncharacterized protein DUF2332 [Labedella gwakjiensis]RUQ85698.1 DUF2332 domain-containing protein [Labedella gwakjiensis]